MAEQYSSLPTTFSKVITDLADLMQKEIRLARAELSEKLSISIRAGVWISVASMLAVVALFCLVTGGLVSYAKARAEGLGLRCDVGIAERSERLLIGLTSAGLSGLGVPYVLAIGLWVLAALSAVTFGQRVLAVHAATRPGHAADTAPGAAEQGAAEQGAPEQGAAGQSGTSQPPAGGTR